MRILLLQSPRTPLQKLIAIALFALALVLGFALLAFGLVAGLILIGALFVVGMFRRLRARWRGQPAPRHTETRPGASARMDVIEGEFQVIERRRENPHR